MDIVQRLGFYPVPAGASPILGVEFSGTVEEVGSQSGNWKVGDEVLGLASGVSLSSEKPSVVVLTCLPSSFPLSFVFLSTMCMRYSIRRFRRELTRSTSFSPGHMSCTSRNTFRGLKPPQSPRTFSPVRLILSLSFFPTFNPVVHVEEYIADSYLFSSFGTARVATPVWHLYSLPGSLSGRGVQERRECHDPCWSLRCGCSCDSAVSLLRRVSKLFPSPARDHLTVRHPSHTRFVQFNP